MHEFLIAYAYYPWLRIRLEGLMRRVIIQRTQQLEQRWQP